MNTAKTSVLIRNEAFSERNHLKCADEYEKKMFVRKLICSETCNYQQNMLLYTQRVNTPALLESMMELHGRRHGYVDL